MLTIAHPDVLQGIRGVESPETSERAAATWSSDVKNPVRDGFGVDGTWEYYSVRDCKPGHQSVQTCQFQAVLPQPRTSLTIVCVP